MIYRVGFKPIAKAIIEYAGRGICTSDYSELVFKNVHRAIYRLDSKEFAHIDSRTKLENQLS